MAKTAPHATRPERPTRNHKLAAYLILAALVLLVYAQTRTFDYILYDDPQYVTSNDRVLAGLSLDNIRWSFTTGHAANWHPLTWLSLMTVSEVFGITPGPQHLLNILLHLANALLLLYVLARATGAFWRSALVATLFAIHPLHVESVAWISERKDVLSTLFWLLTTWAYLRYTDLRNAARYALVLVLFALGLMAKPMLVTLPAVLLLLDYWPLERFNWNAREARRLIIEKIPLFALAAISSTITFIAQQAEGAVVRLDAYSWYTRIANALISYAAYLTKTIAPWNLGILYVHRGEQTSTLLALGALILLAALTILILWRLRAHRYATVGWLWYLGTLVPVIGLIQVGEQAMADRYTYVPLIGVFIIVAWSLGLAAQKNAALARPLQVAAGIAVALYTILGYLQVGYWRDDLTLFNHAVQVAPDSHRAHTLLGRATLDAGNPRDSLPHFDTAIELFDSGAPHMGKGNAYLAMNQFSRAFESFQTALIHDPELAEAYNNLGGLLAMRGEFEKAIELFDLAEQYQPGYKSARENRARAEQMLDQRLPAQP